MPRRFAPRNGILLVAVDFAVCVRVRVGGGVGVDVLFDLEGFGAAGERGGEFFEFLDDALLVGVARVAALS